MRLFLTGVGGFIGFHVARKLLNEGHEICGYDNLNDYYDPVHKHRRLDLLNSQPGFQFHKGDLADAPRLDAVWRQFAPDHVLHLAAQAGVRYSLTNPNAYIHSNIIGFQNVIELVRHTQLKNFVYASSSSVYGGNKVLPFSETQDVSNPISLYAATKLANEHVAKAYSNMFGINATGLRFFTVYGPYGRPDMAMFKFADLIRQGKPIPVYNHGRMIRDFTYIDDIVAGVTRVLELPEKGAVYNLGKGSPENLMEMIKILEGRLGMTAKLEMMPMQAGDVQATTADISKARTAFGFNPQTCMADGVAKFADWYLSTYPAK